MTFYTKSEARAAASRRRTAGRTSDGILREQARAASDTQSFDVFLSHSVMDADLILGVKQLLEDAGLTVYVDWANDPQLDRRSVNKETARLLRTRMRQSRSLIYAATENASASKWMPWELGYFDGFRPKSVAVLPLLDNGDASFHGQEYLGLYPVVNKGHYVSGTPDIFVEDHGKEWTTLKLFGGGVKAWKAYS